MGFFKPLRGDHTAHNEAYAPPSGPPPVREPTYQAPPGPPPSHQFHNSSIHASALGGNEYAPPPDPPPGWQRTTSETPRAPPDANEEPPPYQYVFFASMSSFSDQISNLDLCLARLFSKDDQELYIAAHVSNTDCETVIQ